VTSSPSGIECGSSRRASLAAGGEVLLTAKAASGSVFVGWKVADCSGTGRCTISMGVGRPVTPCRCATRTLAKCAVEPRRAAARSFGLAAGSRARRRRVRPPPSVRSGVKRWWGFTRGQWTFTSVSSPGSVVDSMRQANDERCARGVACAQRQELRTSTHKTSLRGRGRRSDR
jgi:hypothetical protein